MPTTSIVRGPLATGHCSRGYDRRPKIGHRDNRTGWILRRHGAAERRHDVDLAESVAGLGDLTRILTGEGVQIKLTEADGPPVDLVFASQVDALYCKNQIGGTRFLSPSI